MAIATREICKRCGSSLIIADADGKPYCLLCRRPYHDYRHYGRMGGLQTLMRHGREHMAEIGKHGGRPKLRQLPAPEAQIQIRRERLPNRLSELKGLYAAKIKQGEASLRGS